VTRLVMYTCIPLHLQYCPRTTYGLSGPVCVTCLLHIHVYPFCTCDTDTTHELPTVAIRSRVCDTTLSYTRVSRVCTYTCIPCISTRVSLQHLRHYPRTTTVAIRSRVCDRLLYIHVYPFPTCDTTHELPSGVIDIYMYTCIYNCYQLLCVCHDSFIYTRSPPPPSSPSPPPTNCLLE